jgi:hypothetical protein
MALTKPDFVGVVEGFYGRPWDATQRNLAATWFAELGFNTYLYAPKGQVYLRSRWREPFPAAELDLLSGIARAYRRSGVRWGLGLSPVGVNQGFTVADRQALRDKLKAIAGLEPDLVAVLFDDMSHSNEQTAPRQLECLDEIRSALPATQCLVCPTYYSPDPVLEEVFGPIPSGYIEHYQANLSADVGVFWTGPQVCSEAITQVDLLSAQRAWGKRVVLWDNYPVNDGKLRSQHLYLKPLGNRAVHGGLRGHLCNPMNQLHLSALALAGLSRLYGLISGQQINDVLQRVLGAELRSWLESHADRFSQTRLDDLTEENRQNMISVLATMDGSGSIECRDWLAGEYRFDPSCLTE